MKDLFPNLANFAQKRICFLDSGNEELKAKCKWLEEHWGESLPFTDCELLDALINMKAAKQNLPQWQYDALVKFVEFHKSENNTYYLTLAELDNMCWDIYGEMNVLAPYKSYHRVATFHSTILREEYCSPQATLMIRREAANLAMKNQFDTPEWLVVYEKFRGYRD